LGLDSITLCYLDIIEFDLVDLVCYSS